MRGSNSSTDENLRERIKAGTNLQPWQVHILTGRKKAELERAVKEKFPLSIMGEGFYFRIYSEEMTDTLRARRFECGDNLYRTLGIAREDKPGRIRQTMKNAEFFGAPIGMIITVDPCIAEAQLMDCGIFLQTVMLLAEEEGLGSCLGPVARHRSPCFGD